MFRVPQSSKTPAVIILFTHISLTFESDTESDMIFLIRKMVKGKSLEDLENVG